MKDDELESAARWYRLMKRKGLAQQCIDRIKDLRRGLQLDRELECWT